MKKINLDTLTGEEFKQLIEQFSKDGKIDTIPELLAFLSNIPDDMTLEEYIAEHGGHVDPEDVKKAVDDVLDEQTADSGDIDEIFENQNNADSEQETNTDVVE
jgi:hypothetical protein